MKIHNPIIHLVRNFKKSNTTAALTTTARTTQENLRTGSLPGGVGSCEISEED